MVFRRTQVCAPVRRGRRGLTLATRAPGCSAGHPSETAASRAFRSSARRWSSSS